MRRRVILAAIAVVIVLAAIALIWPPRHREIPDRSGVPSEPRREPPDVPSPAPPRIPPEASSAPRSGVPASEKSRAGSKTPERTHTAPVPSRQQEPRSAAGTASRPAAAPTGTTDALPRTLPDVIAPGLPPVAPLPAERSPAGPEPPPPAKMFEEESAALVQILGRYEAAYDNLDAGAAAAIWPTVDVRSLTRAFARLQEQDLRLGDCTFAVSANDAAARCAGVLRYAQRIGDTAPKIEQHVWTIEFVRAGTSWHIVRVTAR